MDITEFVVPSREKALLYGDYNTYQAQLSGRLLKSRRKLGVAAKRRAKYTAKAPIGPEDIAEDHE